MGASSAIIAGGFFNAAFALFHVFFWRVFDWERDLKSLTTINRSVVQILNLCLTFVFLVFAYLSFEHVDELLTTRLGNALLALIAFFWLLRAIEQAIFFGLFIFGASLYAYPAWLMRGV